MDVRIVAQVNDETTLYSNWTKCDLITLAPTPVPTTSALVIPPIKDCNSTIISSYNAQYTEILTRWTYPNTSYPNSYQSNQILNNYCVYLVESGNKTHPTSYTTRYFVTNSRNLTTLLTFKINDLINDVGIYVSPRITDLATGEDLTVYLDATMFAHATYCNIRSMAPTSVPTHMPSVQPSKFPTRLPTTVPTAAPTYANWALNNCIITITDQQYDSWTITWNESHDISAPLTREIFVFVDNNHVFTITENEVSPQYVQNFKINPFLNHIGLKIYQQKSASVSEVINSTQTVCSIRTLTPTSPPSATPTTESTLPSLVPIKSSIVSSTPSPTYYMKIDDCNVLILDSFDFGLYFDVASFNYPQTPKNSSNLQYRIMQANKNQSSFVIYWYQDIETENKNVNITLNTGTWNIITHYQKNNASFFMTIISSSTQHLTSPLTTCTITTSSTDALPNQPTFAPSPLPTYHPPGLYWRKFCL